MSGSEEEDDYLSMTFADEGKSSKESSLQRTARLKREAAERGKQLSKREIAERERQKREDALATQLDSSNKGAQIMAKMGFKGGTLGKTEGARANPITLELKDDRGGIGMDSEKKRKVREAAEHANVEIKKRKIDEKDFTQRIRAEREEKRAEGLWWSAMKVLEGLEADETVAPAQTGPTTNGESVPPQKHEVKTGTTKPLRSVNVLYRPLIKSRLEKEREKRRRNDLAQSLSRNPLTLHDDPEEDEDDKLAYGLEIEDALDDEDLELEEYEAAAPAEKLEKVVLDLRNKFRYCYWCKYRYEDEKMEGCPGLTEDEHG